MKRIFAAALVAASLSAETLDSFVSKVLQKNPEIASMENTLKASYEEIAISSKLDNPELNIQTLNNDFSNPLSRDLSAMQQVTFAITQKIPLTSRLNSKEQSKKEAFTAQKNRLEQKKLDIEFEIKTTAYKIAKLKELEQNYKKYLETTKYAAELLQISSSIESSSHSELVRSQVEIASFERKLTEIASQKNIAFRKLESFGVAPLGGIEISLDAKIEDISKIDISNSGEAKAVASDVESIRNELFAEQKSIVPDVGVMLGYANSDLKYRDFWFFGINIPLPIYGKEIASAKKKTYELAGKKDEEKSLKNRLSYELDEAKLRYESAIKNVLATKKILKAQSAHLLETTLATVKTSKASRDFVFSVIKENLTLENELAEYKEEAMNALAQIKKLSGALI